MRKRRIFAAILMALVGLSGAIGLSDAILAANTIQPLADPCSAPFRNSWMRNGRL